MSALPRPSPIERFLGATSAVPGPLSLLGILPQSCDPEQVLTALDRQLQRVDMHPEGDTPEADEVRLALHAAAAQLLDPAVRQHLLASAGSDGQTVVPLPPLRPGTRPPDLDYDALLVLAQSGGWNQAAVRRLAMLASARGLPSTMVADTLRNIGRQGAPTLPRQTAPPPPPTLRPPAVAPPPQQPRPLQQPTPPPPVIPEPTRERKHFDPALVAAGIFLGAVFLVTLLSMALMAARNGGPPTTTKPPAPAPAQPAPVAKAPSAPAPATPTSTPTTAAAQPAAPAAPAAQFKDAVEALRALRDSATKARAGDDGALPAFVAATEWLAGWWCRLDGAQLRAASDGAVEFVYASAPWPEVSAAAVDALARLAAPLADDGGVAPQQVWPAVWSAGTLLRLTRERDLPAELASRIERALSRSLGDARPRRDTSFEAGAAAALGRLPVKLIRPAGGAAPALPGPPLKGDGPTATVARWVEAASALGAGPAGGDAAAAQERVLVEGLEQIMAAAEPDADKHAFEAIQLLAVEIRWRRGGPARARLVDWFRDARISSGDLNVLTGAMASGSAAEGVTQAMVLPWSAGPPERERLRAEYAAVWAIAEGAVRDSTAQRWLTAAGTSLGRQLGPSASPLQHLAAAARTAALNRAARALWAGNNADADSLTRDAERTAELAAQRITLLPRKSESVLRPRVSTDGQWAVSYLSAGQNKQLRLERLTELSGIGGGLGPADAETLVDAACFASPAEVRTAAQGIVVRHAREPVIVNALLESLPKAPRIQSVSETIEIVSGGSLPPASDPDWMHAARRVLIERLTQLIAAGGSTGGVDDLALMIRVAYGLPEPSSGGSGGGAASGGGGGGVDLSAFEPAAEVRDLWTQLRPVADSFLPNPHAPIPLDRIESRRAGRAALASGPVQVWAAEQTSLAELLSFIVAGEQPSRAPKVKEIMDDLASARRQSTHIFEQISATEIAILRLWMLRYGQESQWSGG